MMKFSLLTVAMAVDLENTEVAAPLDATQLAENTEVAAPLDATQLAEATKASAYHVKNGVFQCFDPIMKLDANEEPTAEIENVVTCQTNGIRGGCGKSETDAAGNPQPWCWLVDAKTGNYLNNEWAFCANVDSVEVHGCGPAPATIEERFNFAADAVRTGNQVETLLRTIDGVVDEFIPVDNTKPVVDDNKPVVDDNKPVVDDNKPVVDDTKPVVDTKTNAPGEEDNAKDAGNGASAMATVAASAIVLCMF